MSLIPLVPWRYKSLSDDQSFPFRIAFNRDELRTRKKSSPPVFRRCGKIMSLCPVDGETKGTWIAVNEFGVAFALLNLNQFIVDDKVEPAANSLHKKSRCEIIPSLLKCRDVDEVYAQACGIDSEMYQPFRLLILDGRKLLSIFSDGEKLMHDMTSFTDRFLFFTSSGLGDPLVEEPRRHLFNEFFDSCDDPLKIQEEFHKHQWNDRPEISVLMERQNARTASHTILDVAPSSVLISYYGSYPDVERDVHTLRFPRRYRLEESVDR